MESEMPHFYREIKVSFHLNNKSKTVIRPEDEMEKRTISNKKHYKN